MGQAAKKKPQASYEIGYGKPPVHARFRKGQSGNPSGRPRRKLGERSKELALKEAYRTLTVRDGEGVRKITTVEAVLRAQAALAVKGNGPAQRGFLRIVQGIEAERFAEYMELLKVSIEYRYKAEQLALDVERGLIKEDPLMPKPDDILVDMRTGEVAFTHKDFFQPPLSQRKPKT